MSPGIAPNAIIDSVRLELLIGRGGMGDIWQGLNTRDQTRVAVKVLREEFLQSTQARERFRREAELTEQLNSAQTLKVIKYALTPDRVPYIIMELLEGVDLQSLIDRDGPLELEESLEIMIEVLKAITEAHQLGIIHRDIKPSNLFKLQRTSRASLRVKILDFGLATQHNHSQTELRDSSLIGTYHFMAPEQAERGPITAKTDLYAFGATLYTLLTGHPPRLPKAGDKSFDHYQQPAPKLRDKHPTIKAPAKLDLLIQRCLAKNPSERPESADVLRRALDQLLSSVQRTAHRVERENLSLAPNSQESQSRYVGSAASMAGHQALEPNVSLGDASVTPLLTSPISLTNFLTQNRERLTQLWTQTITERPNQSRLQTHNLKRKVDRYIEIFADLSSKRPVSSFNSFLEELAQLSFTHPPLDLIPMITLSLFRRVCKELLSQNARLDTSSTMTVLDDLMFHFRQQFILMVRQKRLEETNNALYRLFSAGSETPLLCTVAGVAINTHPRLRAALVGDEKSGLTGRKLFEVLDGFQPIHALYQDLRELDKTLPKRPHRLNNEESGGLANEIILYPHTVGRQNQLKLLIIVDMISERSITEYIPSIEFDDLDFASPQALPWQMTSEVPALKPEQLEALDPPREQVSSHPLAELPLGHERPSGVGRRITTSAHSAPVMYEQNLKQASSAKRAIQKSGVWDNYQQEISHSVRAQQAPLISDHSSSTYSSPHSHSAYNDPMNDEIFDDSISYPPPQEEGHYESPGHSESRHHELSPPMEEYDWQYEDPQQEPRIHQQEHDSPPRDEINVDLYQVSAPPQVISSHNAYSEGSIRPQRMRHRSSPVHDRYHYPSSLASRAPRAPDAQEYLRQGSSHPVNLSQPISPPLKEWRAEEERREIDSSAPTDPPRLPKLEPPSALRSSREPQSNDSSSDEVLSEIAQSLAPPPSLTSLHPPPSPLPPPLPAQPQEIKSTPLPHSYRGSLEDDRGPITFNRRGPQNTTEPPEGKSTPINTRVPVQRQSARISSIQAKVTPSSSWLFNTVGFLIFVGCLFVLRGPVTKWLKSVDSQALSTPLIEPKRSSVKAPASNTAIANASKGKTTDSNGPVVTVKVNVERATFSIKSSGQVLCKGVGFCAMKISGIIVVRSPSHYDLYLDPEQLSQYADKTMYIEMEAEPQ